MTFLRGAGRRLIPLIAGVGILVSLLLVVTMVGEVGNARHLLGELHWQSLVWLFPLALADHSLRFLRWHVLMKRVWPGEVRRVQGVILFSAGSLLIFTPARAGEIAKSVYAREYLGVPLARSTPILVAERVGDVMVMAAMAGVGLLLLGEGWNLWVGGLILGGASFMLAAGMSLLGKAARWHGPFRGRWPRLWETLQLANESRSALLKPGALLANIGVGLMAWSVEVLIYFVGLAALGEPVDSYLFLVALAVFPLASLAGSLSFLPGGVGATEGSLAGLGILIGGLASETALVAALLSRTAILGFVVVAGLGAAALLHLGAVPTAASGQTGSAS
ncbi:MAG: flippase-like domain-containing protein [Chloroflexi bacterium]|nr:flippase-like domain-containing protein [Chloroflexota bacterium]